MVIHRYIEMPIQHVHQILEIILDHLCCLYKFHGKKTNKNGTELELELN